MTPQRLIKEARIQGIRAVDGLTIAEGCRKVKPKVALFARAG